MPFGNCQYMNGHQNKPFERIIPRIFFQVNFIIELVFSSPSGDGNIFLRVKPFLPS
ncbi:MAG: hypothetical protein Q7J03_05650 [Methanoregula sp.]|nr:hypothetical protein [Methanoregula sp.]